MTWLIGPAHWLMRRGFHLSKSIPIAEIEKTMRIDKESWFQWTQEVKTGWNGHKEANRKIEGEGKQKKQWWKTRWNGIDRKVKYKELEEGKGSWKNAWANKFPFCCKRFAVRFSIVIFVIRGPRRKFEHPSSESIRCIGTNPRPTANCHVSHTL